MNETHAAPQRGEPETRGAPTLEQMAEAVHDAYLTTCARLGWSVKPENQVPYSALSEDSKELDRASVRAVLSLLPSDGSPGASREALREALALLDASARYTVPPSPSERQVAFVRWVERRDQLLAEWPTPIPGGAPPQEVESHAE